MVFAERYMAYALQLAERGMYTTDPNPRVGCVIVKDNMIVGEGWHQKAGYDHAEIAALKMAGDNAQGSDLYVTLEPCNHHGRTPPCTDALIKAGIKRIFIATPDPNPLTKWQGISRLEAAHIATHLGTLKDEARKLNKGFFKRMRLKKPYVRSKIAMSLDGRTATALGLSQWITSDKAREDVHKLRAQSSAILTGIGTVIADDPALTVRPKGSWYPDNQAIRQPLRVVVDSLLRLDKHAKLLSQDGPVLVATIVDKPIDFKAECVRFPAVANRVDLSALMDELARRQVNNVIIESGSILNGALLKARLIDELIIYMAPILMGDAAKGLFHLPRMRNMTDNIKLTITDIRSVGKDWRITAIPEY